jgi:CBS-domain-containing membrane protein
MDKSHTIATENSSYLDAYKTFQILGMRHLPVVDEDFQVVGMITRHDLLYFHKSQHPKQNSKSLKGSVIQSFLHGSRKNEILLESLESN